jgi:hypothetical protein
MDPLPASPPAPLCSRHPDKPAAEVCERCGAFICADCVNIKPNGAYCPPCAGRFLSNFAGTWLAISSAGLGFVGLGCAPLGPVALALGVIDLVRIAAKGTRTGGWKLDLAGIGLGLLGILIWSVIAYRTLASGSSLDGLRELAD